MKDRLHRLHIGLKPPALPFKHPVYSPAEGLVSFVAASYVEGMDAFQNRQLGHRHGLVQRIVAISVPPGVLANQGPELL